MRRSYGLLVAIALLISLGLLLLVVSSLGQLHSAIAVVSPLLAQLAVMLIVLIAVGAIGVVLYYAWLFLRPKRHQKITLPESPDEVAAVNLQALQQQVGQIEDEIARQALAERTQSLTQRAAQQTFQIVVFGLGSTGKTALVNALLGEMAGDVAATVGTTGTAQTYRVAVESGKDSRELLITDTPGLLEAGVFGGEREQVARSLAIQADLLLFVIDNDLHRAEYEPLAMLMGMGKRSLLVLNKCDRYLPTEKEQILKRIRERTQGMLNAVDVVAASAKPLSISLVDGTQTDRTQTDRTQTDGTQTDGIQIQPEPEIADVITQINKIWRQEGTDLMAENVLLQSQRLGEDTRTLLNEQRQTQADAIVERYQWVGAGVLAATPLPVVDMLATAAVNAQMVIELGRVYGIAVSSQEAKALALSLAKTMAGLSVAKGAMKMLAIGLRVNLATAVASKLLQGVSAAYLTRIAGKSFITYFQANQDWGDGGIQSVVAQQYQLNRRDEFVKQFLSSAVKKLT
ncbi:MAG: GTP-binding protein [Cyanobacteria bacterium J06627_28]